VNVYQTAIDFSHYQGNVDFNKLCKQNPAMCYIKCTDGTAFVDPWYVRNAQKAKDYGQPYAPYHYLQPAKDGRLQAQWFVSNAFSTDEPFLIDVEEARGISYGYAQRVLDCLITTEQLTGKRPTIYTRSSYWKLYLPAAFGWAKYYRLMVAHYTDKSGPSVCLPWDPINWYLWQYGTPALGYLYGMQTKDLDMSVFNLGGPVFTEPEKIRLYELNLLSQEPVSLPKVSISPLERVREWGFQVFPNMRRN
jgi:lysozyme